MLLSNPIEDETLMSDVISKLNMAKPCVTCLRCRHNWVVASERDAHREFFWGIRLDLTSSIQPADGPASGEHECPKCGTVNLIAREITGEWVTILISEPDNRASNYGETRNETN